jgi:EAL domain-containing protein (putative c-di-GMP-specific phosphodiesterase class I)
MTLASLSCLSVKELRIDRSFVMNTEAGSSDAAIAPSTIDLGHDLGLRVVARASRPTRSCAG